MLGAWIWGGPDDSSIAGRMRRDRNPDSRPETLRSAETLFEYIDKEGNGCVDADEITAAATILSPDRFDTRLEPLTRLEEILLPENLAANRQLSRHEFIKYTRDFVEKTPGTERVLKVAAEIAVTQGGIRRNWWLFIGALPLLLSFFLTLLDNMWKGAKPKHPNSCADVISAQTHGGRCC